MPDAPAHIAGRARQMPLVRDEIRTDSPSGRCTSQSFGHDSRFQKTVLYRFWL